MQSLLRNARIETYRLQDLFQSELIVYIQILMIDYKQPLAILMTSLITRRQVLLFSQLESSQPGVHAQQAQDFDPMLAVYWTTVCDVRLALSQHWLNRLYLMEFNRCYLQSSTNETSSAPKLLTY